MTPANPDALADALARSLIEDKFAATLALRRSEAFKAARLLIAGPLAPLLADLQRVTAERDEAREEAYGLKLAAAGGEDAPGSASLVTADDVRRWREKETHALRTAEARAAQLQAEVAEAQDIAKQLQCSALDAEHWQGEAAQLQAEVEALVGALKPFADFAEHMIDDEGWADREHRASISTWFGPSDFRAALAARAATAREG